MTPATITVALTEDDVTCLRGVVAQLGILVYETKLIELDVERTDRLEQARHLTDEWGKVFGIRADLARAEAKVAKRDGR